MIIIYTTTYTYNTCLLFFSQLKALAYHVMLRLENEGKAEVPASWKLNKTAGKDWLISFSARYHRLSLRKAEDLGVARAVATNDHVLSQYVYFYISISLPFIYMFAYTA